VRDEALQEGRGEKRDGAIQLGHSLAATPVRCGNEFKTTCIVSARTCANILGLKELSDVTPEADTKVHICTIQGLVKRVLFANTPEDAPPIDQYDSMA
jgi:type I restriction enzyme, R subunit